MEISNRAIGYVCITAVAVAAILRLGNQPAPLTKLSDTDALSTATTTEVSQRPRVQNSDFRYIEQPNQAPIDDQSVGAPLVSESPEGDSPATTSPASSNADQTDQDDAAPSDLVPADGTQGSQVGIRERSPNTASWANDETLQQVGDLSNREVFDRWMSVLDDAERDEFRIVWVAMTAEDRQQFLDDLRGPVGY